MLPEKFVELARLRDRDCSPRDAEQFLIAKLGQRARKRFAGRTQFSREDPFGAIELDHDRAGAQRLRASLQEPVSDACFSVFEREVIEQSDEHAQMLTHRTEHAQREFRAVTEQFDEFRLRDEKNDTGFRRARIRRVSFLTRQRCLGERFDGTKT